MTRAVLNTETVTRFIQLAVYALVIVVPVYLYLRQNRIVKNPLDDVADGPIITSQGLLGAGNLTSVDTGKLAGYDYNLLTNSTGRVMLLVTLPRNTGMHIVAVGDKSGLLKREVGLSSEWLEPVSLEGGFPDRFAMYVSKGKQTEVRELFDPEIMQLFYGFCRSYDFELFHESIYVSVAQNARDSQDTTTMAGDLETLLKESKLFLRGTGAE